jgi:hypothetical protein
MNRFKKIYQWCLRLKLRNKMLLLLALWCVWGLIDVNNFIKAPKIDHANFKPYQYSAGQVVRLSDEENQPFSQNGVLIEKSVYVGKNPEGIYDGYMSAINNFPSVLDCLDKSEWDEPQPDLTKINWNKIDNNEEAEVCLFRIASSYAKPEDMKKWFETSLAVEATLHKTPDIYVNPPPPQKIIIQASWTDDNRTIALFYNNWLEKKWVQLIATGINLRIDYDENGNVLEIDASIHSVL